MKCTYCSNTCFKLPDIFYEGSGIAYHQHQCNNCFDSSIRIKYMLNLDKTFNETHIMWEEDNKRVRIFCYHLHNECIIQYQHYTDEWKITEIALDFIPVWDPRTIKNKVKTYLVFS